MPEFRGGTSEKALKRLLKAVEKGLRPGLHAGRSRTVLDEQGRLQSFQFGGVAFQAATAIELPDDDEDDE